MKRDVNQQIEKGRAIIQKHERANLSASELLQFTAIHDRINAERGHNNGLYEVIEAAFLMGVAVGHRQK